MSIMGIADGALKLKLREPCDEDEMYNRRGAVEGAFQSILSYLPDAEIKKDGIFYKTARNLILAGITDAYLNKLSFYFEVGAEVIDEYETLVRMLDTLPADKFIDLAFIVCKQYTYFFIDEK